MQENSPVAEPIQEAGPQGRTTRAQAKKAAPAPDGQAGATVAPEVCLVHVWWIKLFASNFGMEDWFFLDVSINFILQLD